MTTFLHAWRSVGALLFFSAWMPALLAQAGPVREAGGDALTAEQWLQKAQVAARKQNFAGTIVYQHGQNVRASRIAHIFDGAVSHERLQPLDGPAREFIRKDNEVRCLIPEGRRVVIERSQRPESFPSFSNVPAAALQEHYTLTLGARDRVAGRDCQVIEVRPKGDDRYGYRLWVDRASGLLLRSQTLDAQGAVIEQMAFADLRLGSAVDRSEVKAGYSTAGWRIEETGHSPADVLSQGWKLQLPSGFRKLYSARRPSSAGEPDHSVHQAVFSDGLASFSIFIEARALSPQNEAENHDGATHAYSRRVGDSRVVVVGELPPATVRAVAYGIEAVPR
jgi:sigma-E factor negative regulatory protein RseB